MSFDLTEVSGFNKKYIQRVVLRYILKIGICLHGLFFKEKFIRTEVLNDLVSEIKGVQISNLFQFNLNILLAPKILQKVGKGRGFVSKSHFREG